MHSAADINGCANVTCSAVTGSDGVCSDVSAPGVGYACNCTAGYVWNNATSLCDGECRCGRGVVLMCMWSTRFVTVLSLVTFFRTCCCCCWCLLCCAEINACVVTPCSSNSLLPSVVANCTDLRPPFMGDASGRTCSCPDGYNYTEGAGCASECHKKRLPARRFIVAAHDPSPC